MSLLERVRVLILDLCRKCRFIYIDNRNFRGNTLYKDGLLIKGKLFYQITLLYIQTFLGCDFRQTPELFLMGAELHLLQEDRKNI